MFLLGAVHTGWFCRRRLLGNSTYQARERVDSPPASPEELSFVPTNQVAFVEAPQRTVTLNH